MSEWQRYGEQGSGGQPGDSTSWTGGPGEASDAPRDVAGIGPPPRESDSGATPYPGYGYGLPGHPTPGPPGYPVGYGNAGYRPGTGRTSPGGAYGYGYGYPYAALPRGMNTMAILALVLAFVFAPLGLIFGLIARRQIRETGEEGDGLALAGIVIGAIFTAILVIGIILAVVALVAVGGTVSY